MTHGGGSRMLIAVVVVLVLAAVVAFNSLKTLRPEERGVVYRLGRPLPQAVGPGLVLTIPGLDRMIRVPVTEQRVDVDGANITTSGGQSQMDFAILFRVIDAVRATNEVQDYREAVATLARTLLESTSDSADSHDLVGRVRPQLEAAVRPWGIKIHALTAKRFGDAPSR